MFYYDKKAIIIPVEKVTIDVQEERMFYKRENAFRLKYVLPVLCFLCFCLVAEKEACAETLSGEGFQYVIIDESEKTIEITALTDAKQAEIVDMECGSIVIPSAIGGYKVIGIGTSAFSTTGLKEEIYSVTLSEGIEYIGELSFYGLTNLSEVNLPSTLQSMGKGVFGDCVALEQIEIPDNLNTMGARCFYGCTALKSIALPDGMTEISANCFQSCVNLETVELPSTLTSIQKLAFYYCKKLETIEFPKSVKFFGSGAVWGTAWLKEQRDASEDGLVIVNNIVVDGRLCSGNVELPDGIEGIGEYAFHGPENYLETDNMTGAPISSIVFPDSCTAIYYKAFYKCTELQTVTLSDSITTIKDNAFDGCTSLETITLPANLEELGMQVFANCGEVEVIVPDSVPNPENIHFEDMPDVTFQVEEGGNVYLYLIQNNIEIEYNTYEAPEGETEGGNQNPTTEDEKETNKKEEEEQATTEEQQNVQKEYKIGGKYVVKKLRYKVLSKNKVAFVGATNKRIKSLNIPATVKLGDTKYKVTSITKRACKNYKNLKRVVIGNNVTTVGNEAFMNCKALASVTVGKGVKSIGKKVFYKDTKLKKLVIKSKKLTKVGKKAFYKVSGMQVQVPKHKNKKYQKRYKKLIQNAK